MSSITLIGFDEPNMALPATKRLAPASAKSLAFSGPTPPSTSIILSGYFYRYILTLSIEFS